jgi:hypothetical protein
MPQQIIIQLPEGRKLYFGSDARTRLAEISAEDKIATMTADTFKSTLGSLGDLVKNLEEFVGNLASKMFHVKHFGPIDGLCKCTFSRRGEVLIRDLVQTRDRDRVYALAVRSF